MDELKKCNHCDRGLPRSQFYKDNKRKDGLTPYCRAYYAEYYAANRERQQETSHRAKIKRLYGITVEEYDAYRSQPCSICGEAEQRIVLDHCHATNSVRAPLCDGCNLGLGGFRDSPDLLRAAADYIERHNAA